MSNQPNNNFEHLNKTLDLAETPDYISQNQVLNLVFEPANEIAQVQIAREICFIEPLLGSNDPDSTPFGIKHFWYEG